MGYKLIKTDGELRAVCADLQNRRRFGLDTETTDVEPRRGKLRLVQLSDGETTNILDMFEWPNDRLAPFKELMERRDGPSKISHNSKFESKWLFDERGIELANLSDTMLTSQILDYNEQRGYHTLQAVAARHLNREVDKSQQRSDWSGTLTESQLEYAAEDARVLVPLAEVMFEKLRVEGLTRVAKIEFDCAPVTARIESNGFPVDRKMYNKLIARDQQKRAAAGQELADMLAGAAPQIGLFADIRNINIDSPSQVGVAFERLGINVSSGTSKYALEKLAAKHKEVEKLLAYRALATLETRYGPSFLDEALPETSRIHADFWQIGAPTGRFSCTGPNIQNIPHEEERRTCFRPTDPNRCFVISDLSQIELRVVGEMAGEQLFIDAFNEDRDLHRQTAAQVFGVPLENVTKEQRDFAKRLNFGVVYGIGAQRFSTMTGMSLDDAEMAIRRYFQTYRMLDAYLRGIEQQVVRNRVVRTLSGRKIRFKHDSEDGGAESAARRTGRNGVVQGTAADLFKVALPILQQSLRGTSALIVNIVHDEVVVEVDRHDAETVIGKTEAALVTAGEMFLSKVPVKVESVIADSWVK